MRYFNTSGPCDPQKHYTVLRKELIAEGVERVNENLDSGYYVVFSKKHAEEDVLEQEEIIDGKRIHTRIIRVNFEPPSKM